MSIRPGEVHVWLVSPPEISDCLESLSLLLNAAESSKAARFYLERDRTLFLCAHASLRLILSLYNDVEPSEIEFEFSHNGKPKLKPSQNKTNIEFNLSHTFKLAAIGVTTSERIGIDVEFLNQAAFSDDLLERISTDEEIKFYLNQPPENRFQAFYRLWTRKEALLKAVGLGLNLDPDRVFVKPEEISPRIQLPFVDNATYPKLKVLDFRPSQYYVGSVAVENESPRPSFYNLTF